MSRFQPPRAQISVLPSLDTSKRKMPSALKSVTCLAGLPSRGCAQILATPSDDTEYNSALPSGVHFRLVLFNEFERTSNLFTNEPS